MERGQFIQERKVVLTWETTVNNLKALRGTLHLSNLLYEPIVHKRAVDGRHAEEDQGVEPALRADDQCQTAHIYFVRLYDVLFLLQLLGRMTILRHLKISVQVNWKKDRPQLLDLVQHGPMLRICPSSETISQGLHSHSEHLCTASALERLSPQCGP